MQQYANKKEKFIKFYGIKIGIILMFILFISTILSYATGHIPIFKYTAGITWCVSFIYAFTISMIKDKGEKAND